jgi:hypothetical protein
MGMHTARRRGELFVLSMLGLLVLAITALVALSITEHRSGEPPVTNFVETSDQGPSGADPFAGEPTSAPTRTP